MIQFDDPLFADITKSVTVYFAIKMMQYQQLEAVLFLI